VVIVVWGIVVPPWLLFGGANSASRAAQNSTDLINMRHARGANMRASHEWPAPEHYSRPIASAI
jgi:hypothetical protein